RARWRGRMIRGAGGCFLHKRGRKNDTFDTGSVANRLCCRFGGGAGTRNVRKQGSIESRQAARRRREKQLHQEMQARRLRTKAIGSDGKPLKGAAKNSFMAKCVREQA